MVRLLLSLDMAVDLISLDVEIRWLTSWCEDNLARRLEPPLGWDDLPYASSFLDPPFDEEFDGAKRRLGTVREMLASGRPMIWVEDEAITWARRFRVLGDYVLPELPSLLIEPDPAVGITPADVAAMRRFCGRVGVQ